MEKEQLKTSTKYLHKVEQLKIMLAHEISETETHYGAHLSHWRGDTEDIQIDAGGLKVLIEYYEKPSIINGGNVDEEDELEENKNDFWEDEFEEDDEDDEDEDFVDEEDLYVNTHHTIECLLNAMSTDSLVGIYDEMATKTGYKNIKRIGHMKNFEDFLNTLNPIEIESIFHSNAEFLPFDKYFVIYTNNHLYSFNDLGDGNSPIRRNPDIGEIAYYIMDEKDPLNNIEIEMILDEYDKTLNCQNSWNMPDCKNYRYQNNPKTEWCREGVDTSYCRYGECCPFYEKCEDEWELEERHYPDDPD